VVKLWITSFQLAEFPAPCDHLLHESLSRWLIFRVSMQDLQQFCLVGLVALPFPLVVDLVEQHHGKIATRAALACLEQHDRPIAEDVGGGGIVRCFDVAGCDDAQLLVGFVETAFCDPVSTSERRFSRALYSNEGKRENEEAIHSNSSTGL
jgi:hypothetical protein